MIKASIVADSTTIRDERITTFLLTYPRFIHSELLTHRAFARNAASSRAIPLKKMIQAIKDEVAMPIHWGREQKGMQSGDEIEGINEAKIIWIEAAESAIGYAQKLANLGLHKSICNRVIEPFAHMTTLITATEYYNFFNLRAHTDAQREFQELAYQMLDLYLDNKPNLLKDGQWHLPFADRYLDENLSQEQLLKISTARSARTSYLTMDNEISHDKDYDLHEKLVGSLPMHMSPTEHPAMACEGRHGCFTGWKPYRKMLTNENMTVLIAKRRQKGLNNV